MRLKNWSKFPRKTLKWALILTIASSSFYFIYWFSFAYYQSPQYVFVHEDIKSSCVIPKIDPFDRNTLRKYFWHPDPIKCDPNPSWIVIDDDGVIRFNSSLKEKIKRLNLTCGYKVIRFKDDNHIYIGNEVILNPPLRIQSDFFLVTCNISSGKTIYSNLFHQIIQKPIDDGHANETEDDLSIILFGVDSLSRLSALRKLPKTVEYLTKTLNAYVLKGYNKVGENTYPNLLALFTGKPQTQHNIDTKIDFCDKLPFIWRNFSKNGHVTFMAEDWPEIATFNQYFKRGFSKPPVDHYMRPFFLAMRQIDPDQHDLDMIFQFLEYQSIKLTKYSSLCYGNRPVHRIVIDYYIQFLKAYKNKRKFSFSWLNELGHNFVNFFELGDHDFLYFLQFMHDQGHLKNAVLLLFSDHGNRVDEIRNSYVGRLEDRMPFFSIVLPEHFKQKYPHIHQKLVLNQERLTTPYDVFEMLSDILHKQFSPKEHVLASGPISLFKEIPASRSCYDALVPDRHCACYSSKRLDTNDHIVAEIGHFIVTRINQILQNVQDLCHTISLLEISNAFLVENNLKWKKSAEGFNVRNWLGDPERNPVAQYMLLIKVAPNNATYEATVYQNNVTGQRRAADEDIARINRFGKTSWCVNMRKLKDFCYCKNQQT